MIRASLHKPCIKYKRAFKPSEMETVKLKQTYEGGSTSTRRNPIFSGSEGVEGLLFVKERFDQTCTALEFSTGEELFDNFEQVISDTAEARWNNNVAEIPDDDRTADRFDEEFAAYLQRYTTNRGRDYMKAYLNSKDVTKDHDAECDDHAERLLTLIRFTNQMPGDCRLLDDADKKDIVFNSLRLFS